MLLPVSLCRVQVTGSLAVKRPFLSFIFTSLQRLVLSTLSVIHFHSLVKPLLEELQRHETSGVRKETDGRGQKTRQTTFHVKFACIAIFHTELRIQEHRRLISHSSSETFRDEMETEILRKVQQECGRWRETKESYLKGDC